VSAADTPSAIPAATEMAGALLEAAAALLANEAELGGVAVVPTSASAVLAGTSPGAGAASLA
jgi:hypothetical protein